MDTFLAPVEFKFSETGPVGEFSGYGAIFGNTDSHGDVILPKAFDASLAERKAMNRPISMHVMHRGMFGGDGLPVGVWKSVQEDDHGLRVEGKISGMNTDAGRLLYERVKDGALGGLSIGYTVRPNGSSLGKKAGEPKRTLKALNLHEISLVDDPSNPLSRVSEIKAAVREEMRAAVIDPELAVKKIAELLTQGGEAGEFKFADFAAGLQDAHEALTGRRFEGVKSKPSTIREYEEALRVMGFSRSEARAYAEHGYKSAPRDEENDQATVTTKAVLDLSAGLAGFSLPKFK